MEEAKAASYYEEMMRKGEGAAKFKQGLGYSTNSQETFSKGSILSSMSNFVKASSPGKSEGIEKKADIESIREKLRKKDQYLSESRRGRDEKEGQYSSHSLDKRKDNSCDRHSDLSKRDSERPRSSSDKHRRYRSRSRSRSRESRHRSKFRERKSHRSSSRSRRRRSSSRDRRHRSGSRDRRRRSSSRDRRQRQNSRDRRHRSRSREKREDRKRSKNSSCDREKKPGHYKRKYQSTSSSSSQLYGRDSPRRRRGRSISPSRSEDEGHSRRRRSRSPCFLSEDDIRRKRNSSPRKQCTNPSEKIPGFDAMTVAEKLKAKMRSQLSQAEVRESSKGTDERWERFDFNKDAPLDDDSIFDHSEEHTRYKDDTTFLKNAGTTFSSSISQAKREANIQAAHEAAIFGLPVNSNVSNIPCHKDDYKLQDKPIDEVEMECESIVDNSGSRGNVIGNNVINEQVRNSLQAGFYNAARILERSCTEVEGTKGSCPKLLKVLTVLKYCTCTCLIGIVISLHHFTEIRYMVSIVI